jgi:hypothetical protein
MPPEVRGTPPELMERFAIAGSSKNILTMQPAKQLSSHPKPDGSRGFCHKHFPSRTDGGAEMREPLDDRRVAEYAV